MGPTIPATVWSNTWGTNSRHFMCMMNCRFYLQGCKTELQLWKNEIRELVCTKDKEFVSPS